MRSDDRRDVASVLQAAGWTTPVVTPSGAHQPADLAGFIATAGETVLGALTYRIGDQEIEVVTLNAAQPGRGVGTALLSAARRVATRLDARLWLITTDDNTDAQRFYERQGMRPVRVHPRFVDVVAAAKPDATLAFTDAIEYSD
jgi:ribosomal protein S18 acetylase RimI-like enzyme